jgi:hypothetical protein
MDFNFDKKLLEMMQQSNSITRAINDADVKQMSYDNLKEFIKLKRRHEILKAKIDKRMEKLIKAILKKQVDGKIALIFNNFIIRHEN